MCIVDDLGSFGKHVCFVFAAEIDRIAHPGDRYSRLFSDIDDLLNTPKLRGDGVFLGHVHQMRFGVHLNKIGNGRIVLRIPNDKS